MSERREEEEIVVEDYIQHSVVEDTFRTEAYYCTKLGQVKGILLISAQTMHFDAVICQENEYLGTEDMNQY